MSRPERKLRPRAFRLNGDETVSSQQAGENAQADFLKAKIIETDEDVYAREALEKARLSGNAIDALNQSSTKIALNKLLLSWGGLFISAFVGLISLVISAWAWSLVEELFSRSRLMGAIGLVLLGILALCVCVFLTRELRSLLKQY
ncbi:MAG: YcjF family protein, partial [Methylocystis sp.]